MPLSLTASGSGLDRLQRLARMPQTFVRRMDGLIRVEEKKYQIASEIAREMAKEITPIMRANFASSGIQSRTGQLAQAVARCHVVVGLKGLKIELPTGLHRTEPSKGTHKTRADAQYVIAGALNYGAVRESHASKSRTSISQKHNGAEVQSSGLGEKAKRSLKNKIYGKPIGGKASGQLVQRNIDVGGGIAVIKPRPFFYLTPAQAQIIREKYIKKWEERLAAEGLN